MAQLVAFLTSHRIYREYATRPCNRQEAGER